jgi:hypothetical protein
MNVNGTRISELDCHGGRTQSLPAARASRGQVQSSGTSSTGSSPYTLVTSTSSTVEIRPNVQ